MAAHSPSWLVEGPILVLQDTTEFTFQRERAAPVGVTYSVNSGKDKAGRYRIHTVCGLLMHASLAVTTDGLPLGLAAIKFWNRQKFKGSELSLPAKDVLQFGTKGSLQPVTSQL